jgi:hypothetical protein
VYALLMVVAKLLTGIWLLETPAMLSTMLRSETQKFEVPLKRLGLGHPSDAISSSKISARNKSKQANSLKSVGNSVSITSSTLDAVATSLPNIFSPDPLVGKPLKPRSLYPSVILVTAMVVRGEIGFLIASVAESHGIFSTRSDGEESGSLDLYLHVVWAIVICTILGPVVVGILVKRVKALEEKREGDGTERDRGPPMLGSRGISAGSEVVEQQGPWVGH